MATGITLVIRIELTDESDLDWVRSKVMPGIQETIEENRDRLDGDADVTWDTEDQVIPL